MEDTDMAALKSYVENVFVYAYPSYTDKIRNVYEKAIKDQSKEDPGRQAVKLCGRHDILHARQGNEKDSLRVGRYGMVFDFGFNVGDRLYAAFPKHNKVCEFLTDCVKVFQNNVTVHGYVYDLYGPFGVPMEMSLKHLDKRCLFREKKDAKKWLERRQDGRKDDEAFDEAALKEKLL